MSVCDCVLSFFLIKLMTRLVSIRQIPKCTYSALIQQRQGEKRGCDSVGWCVCAGLYEQCVYEQGEAVCVTCLSLSNNLFGCVIDRNRLRWDFNLISAMKETEDRQ